MNWTEAELEEAESRKPVAEGRSKTVYRLDDGYCLVRLVPSLTSFTFRREELILGTGELRLDFYERAAARLRDAGVATVFERRVDATAYVARYVESPPFEVIVKNVAAGSTLRKYPGLFPDGHRFARPVVKLDYRTDPEDQPIAEDYVREFGHDPAAMKDVALRANDVLRTWLAPRQLVDFCIIVGVGPDAGYWINSEVSPDCMRLRSVDGAPLDKDLFRDGASGDDILRVWTDLAKSLD
jgi:phosphoribosylaminoimidazole-succinocarboxamide synthase